MEWIDQCIDRLIGGDSLNIIGLDGSGRSIGLRAIADSLDSDWLTRVWTLSDLRKMDRGEIIFRLDSFSHPTKIPVLFIDDFGAYLVTRDGLWLDQNLFSQVHRVYSDDRPTLRCVVVTHPRDGEIVTDGSSLRDRAHRIYPPRLTIEAGQIRDFGCNTDKEVLLLTGGNSHLMKVGGIRSTERRGNLKTTAQHRLPKWVGQLRVDHQSRLAMILKGKNVWNDGQRDGLDLVLSPLIIPDESVTPERCTITSCIEESDLRELLVGAPWPSSNARAGARRFRARCGNDPTPLWADSFLSSLEHLNFQQLVAFLEDIVSNHDEIAELRVLSSNTVAKKKIEPQSIVDKLMDLSSDLKLKLQWRMHSSAFRPSDLHQRQLILNNRRVAFSLPPATAVIGQISSGNETDAAIDFDASQDTLNAWDRGVPVFPPRKSQH